MEGLTRLEGWRAADTGRYWIVTIQPSMNGVGIYYLVRLHFGPGCEVVQGTGSSLTEAINEALDSWIGVKP